MSSASTVTDARTVRPRRCSCLSCTNQARTASSNRIPSAIRRRIWHLAISTQPSTHQLLMSDKIAYHAPSFWREYRFGVELYAVNIISAMLQCHYKSVFIHRYYN